MECWEMESSRLRQREFSAAATSPPADCTGRAAIKYFVGMVTRGPRLFQLSTSRCFGLISLYIWIWNSFSFLKLIWIWIYGWTETGRCFGCVVVVVVIRPVLYLQTLVASRSSVLQNNLVQIKQASEHGTSDMDTRGK